MPGQAVIELAICVPALVALLVACADGSAMYRASQLADTAAAEGARYAAQNPATSADAVAAYARSSIGAADADVSVEDAGGSSSPTGVRVMGSDGEWREGEATVTSRVRSVRVTLDVELVSGLGTWHATRSHSSISSEVS